VTGLTVPASKVYDGTTATATPGGTAALLTAEAAAFGTGGDGKPYTGDTVTLSGTASGSYNSLTVASATTVTFTGLSTANGNYSITAPTQAATITPKPLTVTGLTVPASKVYDGTTATATPGGTAALLTAEAAAFGTGGDGKPYTGDTVTLSGTASGSYNSLTVASATTVTFTGLSTANGNYSITAPTQAATITPKPLTVTGLTVPASKVYDGTTATATPGGTAALLTAEAAAFGTGGDGKPYTGDTVAINGTASGSYNNRNVASATTVTFTGLSTANGNYSITTPTQAATITPKPLTVSAITAGSTTYDGTTTAKLGGTAAFPSAEAAAFGTGADGKPYTVDSVSAGGTAAGTLAAKDVGAQAVTTSGVTVTGTGSGNYTVTQQTGLTQNVTPKALTMSGLTVPPSKVYDGTTTATVSGTAVLQSAESPGNGSTSDGKPYSGDTVSITGTATGTYNSPNVATATTVTFAGLSLSGTQSGDYSLTIESAASATITPASTSGAIVSSANPALPGTSVTFTMTVSPVPPGAGAPSGTVNFRINGSIGGAGALSGGVAAFATNGLPHGSNTVVAEYAGAPNFLGITNSLVPAEVINTPPIAGNLTIQRYPTQGVKVSVATILASCSDADGDTLTITPSSTSANGATITVSDGWIFYAPASGFTNADSFTYTVADGYGGSAVGTITVAIEVDTSAGQNLTITSLGNGSYLINGNGIPNYTYRLQHTPTLNPANWQAIPGANLTADSTGAFQYTDTPTGGMGFYRTVYP
jgi:hypothetical protein